jgi:hypothetical protein
MHIELEDDAVTRVWMDSDRAKPGKLTLSFNSKSGKQPKESLPSGIVIDQLIGLNADKLKKEPGENETTLYSATLEKGSVLSLRKSPKDASWFHCTLTDEDGNLLEFKAWYIGRSVPDAFLRFPDTTQLSRDITLSEAKPPDESANCLDPLTSMFKLMIAMGADITQADHPEVKKWNWDQLLAQDAVLGARYRAALAKQGIHFTDFVSMRGKKSEAASVPLLEVKRWGVKAQP